MNIEPKFGPSESLPPGLNLSLRYYKFWGVIIPITCILGPVRCPCFIIWTKTEDLCIKRRMKIYANRSKKEGQRNIPNCISLLCIMWNIHFSLSKYTISHFLKLNLFKLIFLATKMSPNISHTAKHYMVTTIIVVVIIIIHIT